MVQVLSPCCTHTVHQNYAILCKKWLSEAQPCRETRLLAEMLYFGLTTGTGLPTLGEEYCDILQVAGE